MASLSSAACCTSASKSDRLLLHARRQCAAQQVVELRYSALAQQQHRALQDQFSELHSGEERDRGRGRVTIMVVESLDWCGSSSAIQSLRPLTGSAVHDVGCRCRPATAGWSAACGSSSPWKYAKCDLDVFTFKAMSASQSQSPAGRRRVEECVHAHLRCLTHASQHIAQVQAEQHR